MIKKLNIEGYRSIRDLSLGLLPINVLTGPNGCGKSNLYNSLVLIARAAEGRLGRAIAEEGGTPSVFFGGRRNEPACNANGHRAGSSSGLKRNSLVMSFRSGLPSLNELAPWGRCLHSIPA